ncbi:MAG: hypothetical protein R6U51_07015 [Anaerolineales bacterium]
MTEHLAKGIQIAENEGVQLIIIQLSIPGRRIAIMQEVMAEIRPSSFPVLVDVSLFRATAGSAGTAITLEGHRAVMVPDTALGTASPLGSAGKDIGETMKRKPQEIIKVQIRSLTKDRGQQAFAFPETTGGSAKAATAPEALDAGLFDYTAEDIHDFLRQIDGSAWTAHGRAYQPSTKDVKGIHPIGHSKN